MFCSVENDSKITDRSNKSPWKHKTLLKRLTCVCRVGFSTSYSLYSYFSYIKAVYWNSFVGYKVATQYAFLLQVKKLCTVEFITDGLKIF